MAKHALMTNQTETTRRSFLIGSAGAGLVMAFAGAGLAGCNAREEIIARKFDPTVWFVMDQDGKTTVNIAKAEMGQHVGTALARVVADELEVDWDDVSIVHVDTDPKWGYMVTGGSWSVHTTFMQLSRAGAAGRTTLIEAGAKLLGVPASECTASASQVRHGDKSISYAQIVSKGDIDRTWEADALEALAVKDPSERRLIGRPTDALDIPEKSTGTAVYGLDTTLPGMVYARPIIPPTRYGSKVLSVDDTEAKQVAGYQEYVILEDPSETVQGWVAVIAGSTAAAIAAGDALKVEWEAGETASVGEEEILAEGRRLANEPDTGSLWVNVGDVDDALSQADRVIEATYTTNSVLHFTLEPQNALVTQKDGVWHIHSGNQWQSLILPVIAKALEVPEDQISDKIIIHQYYLGGGFGRRLYGDYIVPAALTSKALGKPVKMMFTRADDSRFDCVRSPSVQRLRMAVSADNTLLGMDHAAAAGWPTQQMAPGFLTEGVEGGGPSDIFAIQGADHWYNVSAHRVRAIPNELAHKTFLPGWLRAVGSGWTHWAVESFMDETARALGRDPLEFRLAILDAEGRNAGSAPNSVGGANRLAGVLRRLGEKVSWDALRNGDRPADVGYGIAGGFGQERTMPTWTGCVAEVHVNRESGEVTVRKLTSVIDTGTVVHPDGALAQAEGAMLWGFSIALLEGTRFEDGQVVDRNLDTYTPLRMDQVPDLDIEFIESTEMPSGMGEPPMNSVAPAIANAIFDAVGVRLRDLPILPDRILAALSAQEENGPSDQTDSESEQG